MSIQTFTASTANLVLVKSENRLAVKVILKFFERFRLTPEKVSVIDASLQRFKIRRQSVLRYLPFPHQHHPTSPIITNKLKPTKALEYLT